MQPEEAQAEVIVEPLDNRDGAEGTPRGSASGWFSVESDNAVRGWCRDRTRPDQRLEIAILIDGAPVDTVLADRLNAKLAEGGAGDGRYAFVVPIPPAFFDGGDHEVQAEVVTDAYRGVPLKTKRASFTIEPGTPQAAVTLRRIGPEGLDGVLTGPVGLREELDVLLDGQRLSEREVAIEWSWGDRQTLPFRIRFLDRQPLRLLGRTLEVRYPGWETTGASIADLAAPRLAPMGAGSYEVTLGEGITVPARHAFAAEIHGDGPDAPLLARRRLEFTEDRASFHIDEEEGHARMRLRLLTEDGAPIGPDLPFFLAAVPRRLLPNGVFARWDGEGPEEFELGPEVVVERGFYAFPPTLKAQFGLSGAVMAAEAHAAERLLLARNTRPFGSATQALEIGLGLLARASRPTLVTVRVVDGAGAERARLETTVGLRWKSAHRVVAIGTGLIEHPRIELLARSADDSDAPVFLEVAGLHAGDPSVQTFADAPPGASRAGTSSTEKNLAVNADLIRWPAGLAFGERRGRFEVADGWALANPAGAEIHVAALPAPGPAPGRYALALDIPAVDEWVRLEVLLDATDLSGAGEVAFDARLDAGAGGRWGLIDRIAIVRRELGGVAGGTETAVALVARRVALTGQWDRYVLPFAVAAADEARFDLKSGSAPDGEYLLTFEVRRPIAFAVAALDVRLAPAATVTAPAPLRFEDRAIIAQLDSLRGIESWRSADVLRPAVRVTIASRAEPGRWTRPAWLPGSVEVAVTVHNAANETLACLAALAEAGGVPHTVRILDDASDEDARQRILAFIADRPWMSLDANKTHLGYTATANRAVSGSRADWVILLNSDTIVTPGWMEGLLEVAASDSETALVGPVSNAATYQSVPELYDGAGKWAVNSLPPGFAAADMAALVAEASERAFPEVPLLNGFCLAIRREVFEALGGFDARAFPHGYGEENDLCLRAAKAGWRLRVADNVYVHHLKSRSFGPARRTELSKAGDKAFRARHPDVDVSALGRAFMSTPALHALRARVKAAYPQLLAAPEGERA